MKDLYECWNCDYKGKLETFDDIDYDGDVIATCPKCKKNTILSEVCQDEEE